MLSLNNQTALVTGASQGIGKAIAFQLARQGVRLCLGSRRPEVLEKTFAQQVPSDRRYIGFLDLAAQDSINGFVEELSRQFQNIDILVLSGGMYDAGPIGQMKPKAFEQLYQTNVQGVYTLYHTLLSLFNPDFSQVVVINSSAAITAKADAGGYSAACHALKAITDAFRQENNSRNIRVTSLYLGRTATPLMEKLYHDQGVPYQPDLLLQPSDIADTVCHVLSLPKTAEITDLSIRPFIKSY